MTTAQLKNSNIRFKFDYIVNGSYNNFYLDHIRIGEQSSLMMPAPNSNARLSVFPNPSKGNATIALENISDMNVEVSVINILGAEMVKLFDGKVASKYYEIPFDLTPFDKGIYFVKVRSDGKVIMTDKILVD